MLISLKENVLSKKILFCAAAALAFSLLAVSCGRNGPPATKTITATMAQGDFLDNKLVSAGVTPHLTDRRVGATHQGPHQ